MKTYLIQPAYPKTRSEKTETFNFIINSLDNITSDADLILLPEFSNIPGASTLKEMIEDDKNNTSILIEKVISTAKRTEALVAVNIAYDTKTGYRNSTFLYNSDGKVIFRYDKQHLTYAEKEILKLDYSYKTRPYIPCCVEVNGMKIAFMTCYDTYFLEYTEYIASKKPDLILISSYQRSESDDNIFNQVKMISSRCNSYVLRSSYSMGDEHTGGHTLVCDCSGKILNDIKQTIGILKEDIEIKNKCKRSNGHGQGLIDSDEFITQGRTPYSYRPAGSFISLNDNEKPYPRICAHRGFSALCPENSVLSLASAIALDADEVEFDLWPSEDYEIIATHDPVFEKNSQRKVWEYGFDDIMKLDASYQMSSQLEGLRYNTFEEILRKFNHQTIMNIHIKTKYINGINIYPYDEEAFRIIYNLIKEYGCEEYVYIAGDEAVLQTARKIAPHLSRCCLAGQQDYSIVDKAIQFGCKKLQFYKPYFTQEMIDQAHANNIKCNIFWSDDPKEACEFLDMGIDTILTNNLHLMKNGLLR